MAPNASSRPRQRENDRKPFVVVAPSPHAGLTDALRASYAPVDLPPEIARLIARIH